MPLRSPVVHAAGGVHGACGRWAEGVRRRAHTWRERVRQHAISRGTTLRPVRGLRANCSSRGAGDSQLNSVHMESQLEAFRSTAIRPVPVSSSGRLQTRRAPPAQQPTTLYHVPGAAIAKSAWGLGAKA